MAKSIDGPSNRYSIMRRAAARGAPPVSGRFTGSGEMLAFAAMSHGFSAFGGGGVQQVRPTVVGGEAQVGHEKGAAGPAGQRQQVGIRDVARLASVSVA